MAVREPDGRMRQQWDEGLRDRVEAIDLRPGMTLVLSDLATPASCAFHHQEAEDVFGIGFHLKAGSRFDLDGHVFETRALDVWAGAGPRGAGSSFRLPASGFRTVSLRLDPALAADWLAQAGAQAAPLLAMARGASQGSAIARLASLSPAAAAAQAESMFSNSYAGIARRLFLESCALGLLAAQLRLPGDGDDAVERHAGSAIARQMATARDYLDAHIDDPPTIVALARIVGINDFKLKRAFRAAFGTTVFGHVRQRRMERAAGHLAEGMAVAATAQLAGYECPRCFADAYRRHFAILPSQTLRSAKAPARHG
ncbi:helix-turn-helix domain-containing protein [Altererythrobacter xixiisoli]|uniref:Helix-turn-helix domain-containing protein n=1 Tax=Croceibacterium xixiisoli TaxID=1476466 RepID=A0A6I4U0Y6_9SPHN|nr:AraC family transcriptional regulator [Croceibacterium xixiisoli]MXP00618.1 helix-turn-helix domain-containing protein [Croceibacterium xixiisoli]